jgi:two-component system catabolic regulation response regulator CreB
MKSTGYKALGEDGSVDTHIKSLRAKLAAIAPEADPIRTHRGLRYSLAKDPA